MPKELKVLFLAAEAEPFVKIGGLGDVAGSLPPALKSLGGIDIRVAIPFHGAIQRQSYPLSRAASFEIPFRDGIAHAEGLVTEVRGITIYLIAGDLMPADAPVYTVDPGVDGYKFTFFSLAALELARRLDWSPDILHANDWHTAPAIYALWLRRDTDALFNNTATVLGLHNLPYLGVGAGQALRDFGLPPASNSALPWWAQDMPLPLGLLSADHIVAASPTYAREILTPEFGSGLESFLKTRKAHISGILNGIDTSRWDPSTESAISAQYDFDHIDRRRENKLALLREFGLSPQPDLPLLGIVTRMDPQKGIDLVPPALRMVEKQGWQAIFLGTGMPAVEKAIHRLEKDFPDRLRAAIRFDALLSRRIYAGADILLIPSRYEPCGLTQMIAMRYGCIPLARATGGLKDTIRDTVAGKDSTGFLFKRAAPQDLAKTLIRSFDAYSSPEAWRSMQRNSMAQDFSWERFARQYAALYQTLAENREKTFGHGW
jgi:starch synthase